MPVPSYEQILSLAPDDSSAKAGRDLANSRRWGGLGYNDDCVWGECQGSGSSPYRTCVSIADNTFKCTCPSRKFPCKHGIGLFLLLSKEANAFSANATAPDWASEWYASHLKRAGKKAQREDEPAKPPDPVAQAKRLSERTTKVKAGIEDLERWMQDLIRRGTATVHDESYAFWENQAKRMVDAQAPGLARMIRQCGGTASGAEGWQDRLLQEMAQIKLLLEAYNRLDNLPQEVQADVRAAIGFNTSQDEVLEQRAVTDEWLVVAQRVEEDDKLRSQRTWLRGTKTGKYALVLSFAHGNAPLDTSLIAGYAVDADLVFYPGAFSTRALLKNRRTETPALKGLAGHASLDQAFDAHSDALAAFPWLERFPMALNDVTPLQLEDGYWYLQDSKNLTIPLAVSDMVGWQLMSVSGGKPIEVFGEWNGRRLIALSLYAEEYFYRI